MKLKTLFIGLTVLMSCQVLQAQTVTDDQVISYAKDRNKAGVDVKTIGKELVAQGADKEQLKRLAVTYKGAGNATANTNVTDVNRSRELNGEMTPEAAPIEEPSARQIFGHDIFRSSKLTFEPNMSLAIPPTYVLGAGDELIVDVYGASANSQKLKIAPDGTVNIPKIGPVGVMGLTVEQAQGRIRAAMGGHYKNASIKVSVGQTRTITINVMGEVSTPGTYTLSAFATVFHALYMAGGINELGTLREVKVARNGRIISTIDVYEYILTGRLAGSVKLQDNDVIIVGAYDNLVQISGNVKRPMWYEMKKNESVKSLLRFCGGFTGDAYSKSVTVTRRAGEMYSVYTVNEFDYSSFRLADEDAITVGSNEQRYDNIVTLTGAVKRPGDYGLDNIKTLRELIETAGGLQDNAVKNRAVLTRTNEDRTLKTITIDLAGVVAGTSPDLALQNEDVITIASLAEFNDDRTMTIEGEVFDPGTFPYSENTTIEDLIVRAGGLKESASLLNVEVSRRLINPEAERDSVIRTETFNFSLKPNLSIDGDNNFKLKPYDLVSIRRSPVYNEQYSVSVSGEVVFAGRYTLKDNNVRLSDIIKQCGGVKKDAFISNARLIRRMNDTERARTGKMVQLSMDATDSLKVNNIEDTYSVGIDLEKALAEPGCDFDLILRDGDQLIVPSQLNTVAISGEVLYPNNVTFLKDMKYKYYIEQAGGFTKKSLKRHAYILYANGSVAKLAKGKIEPGCQIVVPTKENAKDRSAEVTRWASVASTAATMAAMMIYIFKK